MWASQAQAATLNDLDVLPTDSTAGACNAVELQASRAALVAPAHSCTPPEPGGPAEPSSPLSWLSICRVLFFIGCWYCISITITLYNKWLFSVYGLHFPLLVTSVHIAFKVPMSRVLMHCLGMPPVRFWGWRVIVREVAPSGLAMTGDIALSNMSLLFTTVTYYTIVKSSVPLRTLLRPVPAHTHTYAHTYAYPCSRAPSCMCTATEDGESVYCILRVYTHTNVYASALMLTSYTGAAMDPCLLRRIRADACACLADRRATLNCGRDLDRVD